MAEATVPQQSQPTSAWEQPSRPECLLVCLSPSPLSERLVHATRRLADTLNAKWFALYVETPTHDRLTTEEQEQVSQNLRLAAHLGAQAVRIPGVRIGDDILAFARENQVTKIVVGKPYQRRWRRFLRSSLVDHLVWHCGPIDIYVITGETAKTRPTSIAAHRRRRFLWEYLIAVGGVGFCTVLAGLSFPYLGPSNLIMLYLLTLVVMASTLGRGPSIFASVLSVPVFAYFFIPSYYSFKIEHPEYALTLLVMLVVSTLISGLTTRIRHQARVAREQERQTAALYEMSQNLTARPGLDELLRSAVAQLSRTFDARVAVLLPDPEGVLSLRAGEPIEDYDVTEKIVAGWVFRHGHLAGAGTGTLPKVRGVYLPLRASEQVIGVLRIEPLPPDRFLESESLRLLEALANHLALAMERDELFTQAQAARLQVEAERMRNTLLSSVSHDLRTPLTVIAGCASSLLEGEATLDSNIKTELTHNIYDEAKRLDRLVHNLLDMSRLESGQFRLNQEWHVLEEVVGCALLQLEPQLRHHPVSLRLAHDLPLVHVDAMLLERVFINLLENAVKYTPAGSPVDIAGWLEQDYVVVEVSDRGPGLTGGEEDKIFEKFYQAVSGRTRGAGLGLAICRSVVEAHGGRIWAANREGGGAVFRFTLPLGEGAVQLAEPLSETQTGS